MPLNTRYTNRPHSPVPVHPPFPSFAWVMTTQANPPSDAYAHGYVQNAHTHTRALTQRQTGLSASRTTHRESYQRITKPFLPPPPAKVSPIRRHDLFMVSNQKKSLKYKALTGGWTAFQQTVDHRYDDLPTRPFVPWRASLSSYEMKRFRLRPEVPVTIAPPSCARAKRRRLDVRRIVSLRLCLLTVSCVQSMLRALRRAFGFSKGTTRPGARSRLGIRSG